MPQLENFTQYSVIAICLLLFYRMHMYHVKTQFETIQKMNAETVKSILQAINNNLQEVKKLHP